MMDMIGARHLVYHVNPVKELRCHRSRFVALKLAFGYRPIWSTIWPPERMYLAFFVSFDDSLRWS